MTLTKIRDRRVSFIIANHQHCGYCMKVDCDMGRLTKSYKCPICNKPSDTSLPFFDMDIGMIIDLIQEASQGRPRKKFSVPIHAHSLSALILFCTLREVLLDRLIERLMKMHGLPDTVRQRLDDDNKNYNQRRDRLMPSLIGTKNWKDSICHLQNKTKKKYGDIDDFLKKASERRNEILHEGLTWTSEPDFTKDCLGKILPLIDLYVDFHNIFIHPVYFERLRVKSENP